MAKFETRCSDGLKHTWKGGWQCTRCSFVDPLRKQHAENRAAGKFQRKAAVAVAVTAPAEQPIEGTEVIREYPKSDQVRKASGRAVAKGPVFPVTKKDAEWQADYVKRSEAKALSTQARNATKKEESK